MPCNLLIIAEHADNHVSAVEWGVKSLGCQVIRWSPAPPWAVPGSITLDQECGLDYVFPANGGYLQPKGLDAIWMRRKARPVFPQSFSKGDKLAADYELAAFYGGVLELLPSDIFWANPRTSTRAANYKARQLAAAHAVGFAVPRTLITSSAEAAREFIGSQNSSVIYKPFYPFFWQKGKKQFYTVTTPVEMKDLDYPDQLAWCPGIFQTFVAKAFELRVSVFGRTCVTAKIFDQDPIDWRTRQFDMKVEPFLLPKEIEERIHQFMDELGLVMGMIDLIVTPEGDYVFLEVNEQGQFLWVEEICPDIPMLDICTRFFASKSKEFEASDHPSANLSFAAYLTSSAHIDFQREDEEFRAAGGEHNWAMIREDEEDSPDKDETERSNSIA